MSAPMYDDQIGDDQSPDPRSEHRAPGLGVLGVLALAVAGWGLADGPELPDVTHLGWIAVGVGLLAGLVLIVWGARSRN